MRTVLASLLLLSLSLPALADGPAKKGAKAPALKRMTIANCGCSLLAPAGLKVTETSKTSDGSDLFAGDVEVGDDVVGFVVMRAKEPLDFQGDDGVRRGMLEEFLKAVREEIGGTGDDSLKGSFRYESETDPGAVGWNQYWDDPEDESATFRLGATISTTHIAVLFRHTSELVEPEWSETYLGSFRSDLPRSKAATPAPK